MRGVETASDGVDAVQQLGYDWLIIDTPPAFLQLIIDTIDVADLVVIPIKASSIDVAASEDAVALSREAGAGTYVLVLNDVEPRWKTTSNVHSYLLSSGVPIAETMIAHRAAHIAGMQIGKSAAEVNKGKEKQAVDEIEALWQEVKTAAKKAVKAKAKAKGVANV